MSTVPDAVRSPASADAPDDLERDRVAPAELGEVSVDRRGEGEKPQIRIPISSTEPHRSDGKVMTEEALEDMADQLSTGEIGLWDDHGLSPKTGWREYRREEMYGRWVDGDVEGDVLWATAELMTGRDETASLLDQLEQDMPVGFSVGYKPTDEEMLADDGEEGDKTRHIYAVDLWETSSVGIPDNPEAIAAIAAELDRADVDVGPELATTLANSVREGLESSLMTDTPDDDSTDSGTDPDEGANAGTTDGAETRDLDSEQVDEVMTVVTGVFSAAQDAIRSELAENDDDDEDDEEDEEDDESADVDLDTESGADPDGRDDVDDLVDRLDALEERNEELEQRLDEKEATIDRLESESRESAGRKGMSPAAGSGADGEGDGEQAGTDAGDDGASTSNRPRNALDEAARLGGK